MTANPRQRRPVVAWTADDSHPGTNHEDDFWGRQNGAHRRNGQVSPETGVTTGD